MFQVRLATERDRGEVAALIGEMIPGCDVAARWRWMYETNPAGRALTWLAIAPTGEVAGCTSFFPFRLELDGVPLRCALGGDGYVRPAFRRRGLGGLLHDASRQAMTEHQIGCMYGAPGAMNLTPLKHGGSREVGAVGRYVRPLRGAASPRLAWLGPVERVVHAALRTLGDAAHLGELVPMTPHDPRVDEVWARARASLRLAAVRDAAFYTWRFLEAPSRRQIPYVVVRGREPIAACALESVRGGEAMRIIDLVAPPDTWHAALRAIGRHALHATRAHTLDIKLMALDARRRMMWRSGFVERGTKPFLCMIPIHGDRRFVDPERWFYCGGDSDVDVTT